MKIPLFTLIINKNMNYHHIIILFEILLIILLKGILVLIKDFLYFLYS